MSKLCVLLTNTRKTDTPTAAKSVEFLFRLARMAAFALLLTSTVWAQTALEIAEKSQQRARSQSEHYEGTLQVIDARKKVTEKRWTFDRIGSHGNSKCILRFTA